MYVDNFDLQHNRVKRGGKLENSVSQKKMKIYVLHYDISKSLGVLSSYASDKWTVIGPF